MPLPRTSVKAPGEMTVSPSLSPLLFAAPTVPSNSNTVERRITRESPGSSLFLLLLLDNPTLSHIGTARMLV